MRAAPALFLLFAIPLAGAQAIPGDVSIGPDGVRVDFGVEAPTGIVAGPQAESLNHSARVWWRVAWDPGCQTPDAGFSAQTAEARHDFAAERVDARCDLTGPSVPALALEPPRAWLEIPSLPAAPPLHPAPPASVTPSPPRGAALVSEGEAVARSVPAEGKAGAAAALLLATPVLDLGADAGIGETRDLASGISRIGATGLGPRIASPPVGAPSPLPHAIETVPTLDAIRHLEPRETIAPPVAPLPEQPLRPATSVTTPPPPPKPLATAVLVTGAALALGIAAFLLYQRVRPHAALDHPARAALHAACVARQAPATATELGAPLGLSRKAAEYHLRYLARLGLVREDRPIEGARRFAAFTSPRGPETEPLDERLVRILRERPGLSAADLAEALGVTRTRAERHLRGLISAAHLVSTRRDGERRYWPAT